MKKIISGGQTGVDRAALDAAIELGILHGGYCPIGRMAEDGIIPERHKLIQIVEDYSTRTKLNVESANLTLIVYRGSFDGGTNLAVNHAARIGREVILLDLEACNEFPEVLCDRLRMATVVNVAGPRESKSPGIYVAAKALLIDLFQVAMKPRRDKLTELLEATKDHVPTPEQCEEQRRSFAYGNVKLSNPLITREMIDKAAEDLDRRILNVDQATDQASELSQFAESLKLSNEGLTEFRGINSPLVVDPVPKPYFGKRDGDQV